jgi:hypothetical protein
MIGDGALHSLDDEIDSLPNLRELFGRIHILALFVVFRWMACVKGDLGGSVPDALLLDRVDAPRASRSASQWSRWAKKADPP